MDDGVLRMSAKTNPITFLKDNPPPVFIDEVQKAPELLEQIKIYSDSTHLKSQFYLNGSQQIKIMKGVSESLSGRIGILKMLGLSLREEAEITFDEPFIPIEFFFAKRASSVKTLQYEEIWTRIWRGSMPELLLNTDFDWQMYYASYVNTYLERDVQNFA